MWHFILSTSVELLLFQNCIDFILHLCIPIPISSSCPYVRLGFELALSGLALSPPAPPVPSPLRPLSSRSRCGDWPIWPALPMPNCRRTFNYTPVAFTPLSAARWGDDMRPCACAGTYLPYCTLPHATLHGALVFLSLYEFMGHSCRWSRWSPRWPVKCICTVTFVLPGKRAKNNNYVSVY